MSANYEWQKIQSQQQIQARMKESEAQRAARHVRGKGGFSVIRWIGRLFAPSGAEKAVSESARNTGQGRREEKAGTV
ncbi:MAG: hypothetical protein R3335_11210 [Anaerolineales bacterium]|nr:hypothetical protein [Anaerolineales bacterium]